MNEHARTGTPKGSVGGAHAMARFIDHDETYGPQVVEAMLRAAMPFSTLVDVGAGMGRDLGIARAVCPHGALHAVECYPDNVRLLRERGCTVHAVNIEEESLPFADESIDVVLSNQVLEHVKELFWIFHEMTRVLRVGGVCILGVPNLSALHNRLLMLFGGHPTQSKMCSAHVRCFSKGDFGLFLDECWPEGFRLEKFMGSQFYPFPGGVARRLAGAFPTLAHTIFFMLRKTRAYDGAFCRYPILARLETNYRTQAVDRPAPCGDASVLPE
jgi:SAM-dependent methyltransferase